MHKTQVKIKIHPKKNANEIQKQTFRFLLQFKTLTKIKQTRRKTHRRPREKRAEGEKESWERERRDRRCLKKMKIN